MIPLAAQLGILFGVGLISGFINILAGGGSLLTLPVLIFLGLPGATANGTNRVAILIQNVVAIAGFQQLDVFPWRLSLLAAAPALLGTLVGANLAVDIPDALFKPILAGIMIGVLIIVLIDPAQRFQKVYRPMQGKRLLPFCVGFFFIGLYGGFIQAGVGFLVITLLLLFGIDMVRINAMKVLVIFIFTILALVIFIMHGQVNFLYGIVLGAGNALGGFVATRVAVKKGHAWIRGFVVVMVIIFAAKLVLDSIG